MQKFLKILKWIAIIIVILFIIVLIVGWWWTGVKTRTADALLLIETRRITLDDVMGKNLPPVPDEKLNNSTIGGIDANNNHIRDDVELAIFEKYPDSAKMRAAMLQYAQAIQSELTQVFNPETHIAAIKKEDSAFFCLGNRNMGLNYDDLLNKSDEIEALVLNLDSRNNKYKENFEKYMKTYTSPSDECDIDLLSLPN